MSQNHPGLNDSFSNTQITALTDGAAIAEIKDVLGEKGLKVYVLNPSGGGGGGSSQVIIQDQSGNLVSLQDVLGVKALPVKVMDIALDYDSDSISVAGPTGNKLAPNADGSINTVGTKSTLPLQTDKYLGIRPLPQIKWRTTFAKAIASGVDSEFFNVIQTGSGQTISQSGGNLLLTSGVNTNSETIIRSVTSFSDCLIAKWTSILSQRIANNNFYVELVDIVGDALAMTINSATSVTVTIPSNPFTAENIGQSMYLGAMTVAATIPGRYTISAVSGNNVTFTVAGFPASGSGTCSLFGWNYHQIVYNGTVATNLNYDCQRRGWNSGFTTATISTTASPGHMGIMTNDDGVASFQDQLTASATALQLNVRASRVVNIPEQTTQLYLQIRSVNGSTAPASTTTWTIGMVSVENYVNQAVSIQTVKPQSYNSGIPTVINNTPNVSLTGATPAGALLIGDVGFQLRANATGAATNARVMSAATTNATSVKTTAGRVVGLQLFNTSAALKYFKFYNKASAPTVGTDTPILTLPIPAGGQVNLNLPVGIAFTTGIAYAITGALADTDATAVALNDVVGALWYA